MSFVCRVGDTGSGVCPAHQSPVSYNVVFTGGASSVMAEGSPMVRVGDVGDSTCGHPVVALDGAATTLVEGPPPHRVGDSGSNAGTYVADSGSSSVTAT